MKLLIIKIGAIGDVVMTLPMVHFLRKERADFFVTWVVGKTAAPLLRATGLVGRLIEVDEEALFHGSWWRKGLTLLRAWWQVGFRRFDLKLILHVDPRYRWVALLSRAKETKRLGATRSLIPGRYHAEEYLRLATGGDGSAPATAEMPPWNYPLPENLRALFAEGKVIALAPGGAKNALADDFLRRWPIDRYALLAQRVVEQGYKVVITGSATDGWVVPYFEGIGVTILVGKTTLPELVSCYQRCALLVTHDSGSLHLAKLARCPTVSLFGPTVPSSRVGRGEKIAVIWGGESLACRPCYDGKHFAPGCRAPLCLQSITVEEVLRGVFASCSRE